MNTMRIVLALSLVILFSACDSGGGDPTETRPSFIPLQAGNTWSYARSLPASNAGANPFTVAMTQGTRDGRTVFEVASTFGQYDDAYYEYIAPGLRRVKLASNGGVSRDFTYNFDLTDTIYTQAGAPSRSDWDFYTLVRSADSTIATPAGTFDTVVLQTVWEDEQGDVQTRDEEYFAEGVGVVRYKTQLLNGTINQWDLTSYQVGSTPVEP